jgi:hypothetical protein
LDPAGPDVEDDLVRGADRRCERVDGAWHPCQGPFTAKVPEKYSILGGGVHGQLGDIDHRAAEPCDVISALSNAARGDGLESLLAPARGGAAAAGPPRGAATRMILLASELARCDSKMPSASDGPRSGPSARPFCS